MIRRKGDRGFHAHLVGTKRSTRPPRGSALPSPKRIGWFITSRGLTNESYYAHQKAARFFGTNNVDTSARICHAPSTLALTATVGVAATTCSYKDWIGSDLIVFVGSNIANNQPVATKYLYYAKQQGTKVFVINPYMEPGLERYWIPSIAESAMFGTKFTDDFFPVHIGGDTAFFYGVLKHLIENDWVHHHFIKTRTAGWEELRAKVRRIRLGRARTGLRANHEPKCTASRRPSDAPTPRSSCGAWGSRSTATAATTCAGSSTCNWRAGNVGREKTGLMPIRGHSGVQGGAEMGGQPKAYVMGVPVSEENAEKTGRVRKSGASSRPPSPG